MLMSSGRHSALPSRQNSVFSASRSRNSPDSSIRSSARNDAAVLYVGKRFVRTVMELFGQHRDELGERLKEGEPSEQAMS